MQRLASFLAVLLIAIAGALTQRMMTTASASPAAPPDKGPVVVELFTSEGCSSCPPADAFLHDLATQGSYAGVPVIPLGWHVDYWDHQGWKDRYSAPSHTGRQQDYADAFRSDQVYTPQMVVDGREEFVGSSREKARSAIVRAAAAAKLPVSLALEVTREKPTRFTVAFQPPADAPRLRVLLLVTETDLVSAVGAGENRGETIRHGAVVRLMKRLDPPQAGKPYQQSALLDLDRSWKPQDLRGVLLVQDERTRAVIGAASVPLR